MRMKRMVAAAGAVSVVATLAACGADGAGSGDGSQMQVMMFPSVAYRLPVIVAQEKGFFEDEGIDITVVAQPNNLQGVQALEATKSQAGMLSATTVAQGYQAGSDVKLFCGGLTHVQSSMIAPAGSDLPSVNDGASADEVLQAFEGKKVGSQTPVGSGFQLLLQAALEEAGVEDVTWVNVGGSNSVTQAALDEGSVDVAQASPPGTQNLVENGVADELIYMPAETSIFGDLYGSGWVAPTAWLDENSDTAKAFCDATATAIEFINDEANLDEVRTMFMSDTGVADEAVADAALPTYQEYSADLPVDMLEATFEKYEELGIVKPDPKVTTDAVVDTVGR